MSGSNKRYTYLFLVTPDNRVDAFFYADDLPSLTGNALRVAMRINPNLGERSRRAFASLGMRRYYSGSQGVYAIETENQLTRAALQEIIDERVAAGTLQEFLDRTRLRG